MTLFDYWAGWVVHYFLLKSCMVNELTKINDDDGALFVDSHEERDLVDKPDRRDRIRNRIETGKVD